MRKTLFNLQTRIGYAAIVAAGFVAAPLHAAEDDLGAWAIFTAGGPVAEDSKIVVAADVQARFNDDASRMGQLLMRASAGYKVTDDLTLSLGYAYVRTNPVGPALSEENRIFQQAGFTIAKGEGFTLKGRSRFEQRFIEGPSSDVGLRFRQQVSLTVPLGDAGGPSFVAYTEPFIALNDTDFGARSGINRWRNFAGINIPVGKKVAIEPGYLNQYVNRRSRPDLSEHIFAVGLKTKF